MDDITQEKLTTIARNQREIYNNGIAEGNRQGRQEVISKSKYIEKTVSGKGVFLNDVSEVAHKVKVYAGTPTEVTVCGKNLFDISTDTRLTKQDAGSYINNVKLGTTKIPLALPYGTYVLSYDLACPTGKNTRIRVYLKDGSYKETATSSTGDFIHFETSIVGEIESWGFYYASQSEEGTMYVKNAQIEFVSVSPYEEYKEQTITATPDVVEIPSMCPIMNFFADSEITVDYYSSYGMAEKELAMWKALTFNGARKQYQYAFANTDYTGFVIPDGMCKPSSAIAYMLYNYQGVEAPKGIDCSGFNGTNQTSQGNFTFYNSPNLIKIYDMGIPAGILLNNTYSYCRKLEEIEIIRCNENTTFTSAFISCAGLIKVIFSGRIASDINLQWSTKLSLESLISLFSSLKVYYSDDADYCTKTITLSAESWALTESQDFQDALGYTDGQAMCRDLGWNYA